MLGEDYAAQALAAARQPVDDELLRLREFARAMFDAADWPHGGDIDGFALQEAAVKAGLLVPEARSAPCGETCNCAEYYGLTDLQEGVTCYRKTESLSPPETAPA